LAKAREIPDLDPGDPYRVAAARVVEVRTAEVVEHAEGVQDLNDIEPLHAMRVATRRLRAALEVFAPCFPKEAHRALLTEVKEMADALGERRDRDVSVETLEAFAESLAAADRRGIGGLVEQLRREQGAANDALDAWVSPERLDGISAKAAEMTEAAAR
jgi:CHAD domain-containing protein